MYGAGKVCAIENTEMMGCLVAPKAEAAAARRRHRAGGRSSDRNPPLIRRVSVP